MSTQPLESTPSGVRTSASHPLRVDWAVGTTGHRVGVTFAPGKQQAESASGGPWARDLAADLDRLARDLRVSVLGSLVEEAELGALCIPTLVPAAAARGLSVLRFPVVDGTTPASPEAFRVFVEGLAGLIEAGHIVAVHCKGGMGRAGTTAACVLIELGSTPEAALAAVRAARGANSPENAAQVAFVLGWIRRAENRAPRPALGVADPFADVFTAAWRTAAVAHHGEARWKLPGPVQPAYIGHVGHVMLELLAAHAASPIPDLPLAVPVAALHDCIEDTALDYAAVRAAFGEAIADGVAALSKDPRLIAEAGKAAAMADSLARTRVQPRGVWCVKLADRITNLLPPPESWTPARIEAYREEARAILAALGSAHAGLADRLARRIEGYGRPSASAGP